MERRAFLRFLAALFPFAIAARLLGGSAPTVATVREQQFHQTLPVKISDLPIETNIALDDTIIAVTEQANRALRVMLVDCRENNICPDSIELRWLNIPDFKSPNDQFTGVMVVATRKKNEALKEISQPVG
jgi:hypothetical protein